MASEETMLDMEQDWDRDLDCLHEEDTNTNKETQEKLTMEQTTEAVYTQLNAGISELSASIQGYINWLVEYEMSQNEELTEAEAKHIANDYLYKFLFKPFSTASSENKEEIKFDTPWQASDGTVFLKEPRPTATITLADYLSTVKRTQRPGEDRKAFTPLAKKTAKELGFELP